MFSRVLMIISRLYFNVSWRKNGTVSSTDCSARAPRAPYHAHTAPDIPSWSHEVPWFPQYKADTYHTRPWHHRILTHCIPGNLLRSAPAVLLLYFWSDILPCFSPYSKKSDAFHTTQRLRVPIRTPPHSGSRTACKTKAVSPYRSAPVPFFPVTLYPQSPGASALPHIPSPALRGPSPHQRSSAMHHPCCAYRHVHTSRRSDAPRRLPCR